MKPDEENEKIEDPSGRAGSPFQSRYSAVALSWFLIVCFAVGLRLAFQGRYLEGWDSVNFALGVEQFNPLQRRPHFPGYPVYIAAAKLFYLLGADPVKALTLTSAIGGGLAVLPLMVLTKQIFDARIAILTGILYSVNPLLWLEAEKVYSDSFGLLTVLGALACAAATGQNARWTYAAGLMMGLTLGVRFSYFPFILTLAWLCCYPPLSAKTPQNRPHSLVRLVNGGIVGVGIWAIPLLARFPSREWMSAGEGHIEGHFTRWDGTVTTDPGLLHRLGLFFWNIGANGFGLWWPDAPQPGFRILLSLLTLLAMGWGLKKARETGTIPAFLAMIVPYGVWIFFWQNLTSVRHVLPLVALLLPLLAAGIMGLSERTARRFTSPDVPLLKKRKEGAALVITILAGVLTFMAAYPLVDGHFRQPPTRVQAARFLQRHYDPHTTSLLTWNSARVLEWYAPEWVPSVHSEPPHSPPPHRRLLALSDYPYLQELKKKGYSLKEVKRFHRSRYIHTWFHELILWEASG